MLINLQQKLYEFDGAIMMIQEDKGSTQSSLFRLITTALFYSQESRTIPGEKKMKAFDLWINIKDMEDFDFSADDTKTILDLAKTVFGPLVLGQINSILNGRGNPLAPKKPVPKDKDITTDKVMDEALKEEQEMLEKEGRSVAVGHKLRELEELLVKKEEGTGRAISARDGISEDPDDIAGTLVELKEVLAAKTIVDA